MRQTIQDRTSQIGDNRQGHDQGGNTGIHYSELSDIPSIQQVESLTMDSRTTGNYLAQITRMLLRSGDSITARKVMDAALERGGDEVASLATFTEKRDGVAYGRMRLILGRTATVKCLALCDLGVLELIKGNVSGARGMFRRAVDALPSNQEASLWFHLVDRWGEHLGQFFTQGQPLPTMAAHKLSLLLPDSSNGYQSIIRQNSSANGATKNAA